MSGNHESGPDDETLRLALRGLRRDAAPQRDLWPRIASRIASEPRTARPASVPMRRIVPWALAASVLLALVLVWRLYPLRPRTGEAALIAGEAQAMTEEYRGALKVIAASTPIDEHADPALRELDHSASQIRSALARDPDARFLLDRLHHTYSLRLALTQRAVST